MQDIPVCECGQRAIWRKSKVTTDLAPRSSAAYLCDLCWCELTRDFPICMAAYSLIGLTGCELPSTANGSSPVPALSARL